MTPEFQHKAPKGYSYEFEPNFKRNVTAIWICHDYQYVYNQGKPVRCIWGFYNSKTKKYHSPINSKTVGDVVDIRQTRAYTAMPIHRTVLEECFL